VERRWLVIGLCEKIRVWSGGIDGSSCKSPLHTALMRRGSSVVINHLAEDAVLSLAYSLFDAPHAEYRCAPGELQRIGPDLEDNGSATLTST
jgi:hypothetical protein